MIPAPRVMSARMSSPIPLEPPDQRRGAAESAKCAAAQPLVERRGAADAERPGLIDSECGLRARAAAEPERSGVAPALNARRNRQRDADVLAELQVRIDRARVRLVPARVVVAVRQIQRRFETVR